MVIYHLSQILELSISKGIHRGLGALDVVEDVVDLLTILNPEVDPDWADGRVIAHQCVLVARNMIASGNYSGIHFSLRRFISVLEENYDA